MYIGRVGILQAARRPSTICVVNNGRICNTIKGNRPIAPVDITIGNYIIQGGFALFDTGASESVLCLPDARRKFGFDPYEKGIITGLDGILKDVYYYDASLKFTNTSLNIDLLSVYEGSFDYADIIIGMDIISKGKLIVDGKSGTFSFEI